MVINCPHCYGSGNNSDGWAVFSREGVEIHPATKCWMCKGQRFVSVAPATDDEIKLREYNRAVIDDLSRSHPRPASEAQPDAS